MSPNPNNYSVRAVERALNILNCFSFQKKELTLNEITNHSGLSKSTIYRLLHTLEKNTFVSYNPTTGKYQLGLKLFELGGIVLSSFSLRQVSSHYLDLLNNKTAHTIFLGILEGGELVYIDKREGGGPIKFSSEIGRRRVPYFGALGKAIMAFLSESEIDKLLDRYPLKPLTSRTITDLTKFKESLKEIRKKGYALEYEEAVEGAIGIAAPIKNHLKKVIASVGVALPTFNSSEKGIKAIIKLVKKTAQNISTSLGYLD